MGIKQIMTRDGEILTATSAACNVGCILVEDVDLDPSEHPVERHTHHRIRKTPAGPVRRAGAKFDNTPFFKRPGTPVKDEYEAGIECDLVSARGASSLRLGFSFL